jgi:hypothetical protein
MPRTSPTPTLKTVEELLAKGDAASAAKLVGISDTAAKEVRKAAKRALYLLKQRGVLPKPASAEKAETPEERRSPIGRVWTGLIGPEGLQTLMFEVPDPYGGASTTILFTLHDATGIRDVQIDRTAVRDLNEFDAQEQTQSRFRTKIPPQTALSILSQAVAATHASRTLLPKGFGEAVAKLGGLPDTPEEWNPQTEWDPGSLAADETLPRDPDAVMQRPGMLGWLVPMRFCRPWAIKFLEAYNSPLELSESQLREKGEAVIKEACDTMFQGALPQVQARLWANASLYRMAGDEESARLLAKQAAVMNTEAEPSSCGLVLACTRNGVHLAVLEITRRMEMEAEAQAAHP